MRLLNGEVVRYEATKLNSEDSEVYLEFVLVTRGYKIDENQCK